MQKGKRQKKAQKLVPVDGLSAKDIAKIRAAIRKVWSWSYPRKLCLKRATLPNGFAVCELCGATVAKVFADHIQNVGDVDSGFIERLFTPSKNLQAICKKCHDKKTRDERALEKMLYG